MQHGGVLRERRRDDPARAERRVERPVGVVADEREIGIDHAERRVAVSGGDDLAVRLDDDGIRLRERADGRRCVAAAERDARRPAVTEAHVEVPGSRRGRRGEPVLHQQVEDAGQERRHVVTAHERLGA